MGTYYFKCSVCGKPKSARNEYFTVFKRIYNIKTAKELSKVYVCQYCGGAPKKPKLRSNLEKQRTQPPEKTIFLKAFMPPENWKLLKQPKMVELRQTIERMAQDVLLSNYAKDEVIRFDANVKYLLDIQGIGEYTFVISEGKLVGIVYRSIDGCANVAQKLWVRKPTGQSKSNAKGTQRH